MNKYLDQLALRCVAALLVVLFIVGGVNPAGLFTSQVRAAQADTIEYNATVYCDGTGTYVNVRDGAGTVGTEVITQLYRGARVKINQKITLKSDPSGNTEWCDITFLYEKQEVRGFVIAKTLVEDVWIDPVSDPEFELMLEQFPESYRPYLRNLHKQYPSWEFVPMKTSANWQTCLKAETKLGVSAISSAVPDTWKSHEPGAYDPITGTYKTIDSGGWVNADPQVVAYYLDPRNMLFESQIFQFLDLGYLPEVQTREAVSSIINNTFMTSWNVMKDPTVAVTHLDAIMDAALMSGLSPVYLASKIIQEVGVKGSDSIFGTGHNGLYPGYYNYYNIGAYAANGMDAITRGLWYASSSDGADEKFLRPWDNGYKAIVGGAMWQSFYYYTVGQNTLYLMKFNVAPVNSNLVGTHQYMTNIRALENESAKMYKAYSNIGKLSDHLVFKIPVYENMPDEVALMPSTIGVDQFVKDVYKTTLGVEPDSTSLRIWSAAIRNASINPAYFAFELVYSPAVLYLEMNDDDFLAYLYNALLDRDIDPEGKAALMEMLQTGSSRAEVTAAVLNSPEFQHRISRYSITPGIFVLNDAEKAYDGDSLFICRLYRKVLERDPEYDGFDYWVNRLRNEGVSYSELVRDFALSPEAYTTFDTNEKYVGMLYHAIFDRDCDKEGNEFWMAYMNFGYNREEVLEGFLESQEFDDLCRRYGGKKGTYKAGTKSGLTKGINALGVSRFVKRMYEVVLDRDCEQDGYLYWGNAICTKKAKGADMAIFFVFSDEYLAKNTSDEEYLKMLYKAIMGREAEGDGFEYWLGRLTTDMTRKDILLCFVDSPEYEEICKSFGIEK